MRSYYPIRDIFFQHYEDYKKSHYVTPEQDKAAFAIANCKTGNLGYNSTTCESCGNTQTFANSCRNRHCPSCQAVAKEMWLDARSAELIDGPYFHVVFTVPSQMNDLIYHNQKVLYGLLHNCSAHTIIELAADKKYLGAEPAIIQLLHSWGQELNLHPHIHAVVSGTGLTKQNTLKTCGKSFFLPAKVVASKFRGKFMAMLKKAYKNGKLFIPDSIESWDDFCNKLYSLEWNVHIKETFNGLGNAVDYLARYAYRVAISNNRIISITDETVTFTAKDYKTDSKKTVTLTIDEFIRRFLMHILPNGFQKIRYYGILKNHGKKERLKLIFRLQGHARYVAKYIGWSRSAVAADVWGLSIFACPCCGLISLPAGYKQVLRD